tara:strand:+ start:268 stop:1041 length:774 start_codon:yes stop_codon:yes gene_type:complete
MAHFTNEADLLDELRETASKLRQENQLQFAGFSQASLEHYENLWSLGMDREAYNETKHTYHDEVKPQITDLITDLMNIIRTQDSGFNSEPKKMIGDPFPQANPAGWAWAALTRDGRTRRNDLQFFVALKRRFLRIGLYAGKVHAPNRVKMIVKNIHANQSRFLEIYDQCLAMGLHLTPNEVDDGSVSILEIERSGPHVSIGKHGHFNLIHTISLEELPEEHELIDIALQTFVNTRRMYEFLLKKHVEYKFRLLEDAK